MNALVVFLCFVVVLLVGGYWRTESRLDELEDDVRKLYDKAYYNRADLDHLWDRVDTLDQKKVSEDDAD